MESNQDMVGEVKKTFSRHGMKLTHQRLEIYRVLEEAKDHPSAETVWKRVRRSIPTISLDTVYRTLGTFEQKGMIQRVPVEGEQGRYDGDVSPHHHMVCTRCREIVDFWWPEFDEAALPKEVAEWGRVHDAQLIVRGECAKCGAKPL